MIKFVKLKIEHLQLVLKWRTNPEIAKHLFTEVDQSIGKQLTWFNKISSDETVAYWIIEYCQNPIGLINLASIDRVAKKCNAGFYVGNAEYRQLAALILPYFYNFIFKKLKFHKVYGEVLSTNDNILKIHMMQGYRHVGTFKDHMIKDGRHIDVHLLELMKEDWHRQKRYQDYEVEFEGVI
jgi:UDP-4-amino-4,6-dideoxy-N-acetyl-beta-L-altrosamine N-acetyltransferase